MQARRKGFTLIELLVVLAITGILAAVALLSYQGYAVRARVMEGLGLTVVPKLRVTELAARGVGAATTGYSTGFPAHAATANVGNIEIAPDTGVITITYSPRVQPAASATLTLTPYARAGTPAAPVPLPDATAAAAFTPPPGNIQWRCRAAGAAPIGGTAPDVAGTLPARFAPAECR